MDRSPVQIWADNVYLQPPAEVTSLDEHAADVRRVLIDDQVVQGLRRELIADLSDAEYFREELRKMLGLSDELASAYPDSELVGITATRLISGELDRARLDRVREVVNTFPEDWTVEDLARNVRSALHPLSGGDGAATAAMTPPAQSTDALPAQQRPSPQPRVLDQAAVSDDATAQQPAVVQLPVAADLFKREPRQS